MFISAYGKFGKYVSLVALVLCSFLIVGSLAWGSEAKSESISGKLPPGSAPVPVEPGSFFLNTDDFTASTMAIVMSDYLGRGLSQSNHQPSVQGLLDVTHKSGISVGTYLASLNSSGATGEADLYAGYGLMVQDVYLSANYYWYNYPSNPTVNSVDHILSASYRSFKLEVSYIPKYGGVSSNTTYVKLSNSARLTARHSLNTAIGYSWFSDEAAVTFKNYLDYKVGISTLVDRFNFELFWSNTTRENTSGTRPDDGAAVASLSVAI